MLPGSPFFGTAEQLLCWRISVTLRRSCTLRSTRVNAPALGTGASWGPVECRKQHQIWGVFLSIWTSRHTTPPFSSPYRFHQDFTTVCYYCQCEWQQQSAGFG